MVIQAVTLYLVAVGEAPALSPSVAEEAMDIAKVIMLDYPVAVAAAAQGMVKLMDNGLQAMELKVKVIRVDMDITAERVQHRLLHHNRLEVFMVVAVEEVPEKLAFLDGVVLQTQRVETE